MDKRDRSSRTIVWLYRVGVMCRKELVQFFRNWVLALFLLCSFTWIAYNNATAISRDLKNAQLIVIDNDRTASSRELIYRFRQPQFRLADQVASARQAMTKLDSGTATVVLDIPEQFEKNLFKGRHAKIQMQLDGADANRAYLTANYSGSIIQGLSQEVAVARSGILTNGAEKTPVIENEQRVWFSPNHEEILFNSIVELAKNVLLFSLLLPAAALAREKERGTVEQLLVSPLTPLQIMLGKTLPMTLIILSVSTLCLFVIIEGALQVDVRGSISLFLAITAMFSFAASSLGVLIASLTRSIGQVGIVAITLMPIMMMLSGSDTPPEMMPEALLPVMYLSPMHHYLAAVIGILIKGATFSMIWDSVFFMALLGGIVFGISLARFRMSFR